MVLTTVKANNIGEKMTEKQYRAVELDSYSSLKVFCESPMKFYRTYITKEIKREPVGKDGINGALVHSLLERDDNTIDEYKFLIADVSEIDKSKATQIEQFALEVWRLMELCVNEEGVQTKQFTDLAQEAFDNVRLDRNGEEVAFKKKDLVYAIERFSGSKTEQWLNQKRKAYGKILVSIDDVTNAEKIVETLRSYSDTMQIYTQKTNDRYKVYKELQVLFHYEGINLKMMADEVIVDTIEKTVTPYDTKVTWEESFRKQYLDKYYYIQGIVYDIGLDTWMAGEGLYGYKRLPMHFVRVHSLGWYNPLIVPMTELDLEKAREGFTLKSGREYKGLKTIIKNLQWCLDTGNWKSTREQVENGSKQLLEIPYQ